jgi:hypothetical protein
VPWSRFDALTVRESAIAITGSFTLQLKSANAIFQPGTGQALIIIIACSCEYCLDWMMVVESFELDF